MWHRTALYKEQTTKTVEETKTVKMNLNFSVTTRSWQWDLPREISVFVVTIMRASSLRTVRSSCVCFCFSFSLSLLTNHFQNHLVCVPCVFAASMLPTKKLLDARSWWHSYLSHFDRGNFVKIKLKSKTHNSSGRRAQSFCNVLSGKMQVILTQFFIRE